MRRIPFLRDIRHASAQQAAVFLLTAVLLVPLFQRLKLGAVLGYLGAGMLIGPFGLGMIGEVESTLQFARVRVVLLLFPRRAGAAAEPPVGYCAGPCSG